MLFVLHHGLVNHQQGLKNEYQVLFSSNLNCLRDTTLEDYVNELLEQLLVQQVVGLVHHFPYEVPQVDRNLGLNGS